MTWKLTDHAQARMQQRGMREEDLELILNVSTEIAPGRFCLRRRDVRLQADLARRCRHRHDPSSERRVRGQLRRLERLVNRIVVAEGDTIITAWTHAGRLRGDRHRQLAASHRRGLNSLRSLPHINGDQP